MNKSLLILAAGLSLSLVPPAVGEPMHDDQIKHALEAIAAQRAPGVRDLQVNAVLGDYARAMRLKKRGKILSPDLRAAVFLGGLYLDQPNIWTEEIKRKVSWNETSSRDPLNRTALMLLIDMGRDSESILGCLEYASEDLKKAEKRPVDAKGNTLLHYAAERADVKVLTAVLKLDPKALTVENAEGLTPVDVACRTDRPEVLAAFLDFEKESGHPVAILPQHLALAVSAGSRKAVEWLVDQGVDVNGKGVMKAAKDSALQEYLVSQGGVLPTAE